MKITHMREVERYDHDNNLVDKEVMMRIKMPESAYFTVYSLIKDVLPCMSRIELCLLHIIADGTYWEECVFFAGADKVREWAKFIEVSEVAIRDGLYGLRDKNILLPIHSSDKKARAFKYYINPLIMFKFGDRGNKRRSEYANMLAAKGYSIEIKKVRSPLFRASELKRKPKTQSADE